MIYREHLSYPGYGYIEPIMDQDDPLIDEYVAAGIIEYHLKAQRAFDALRDSIGEADFQKFLRENPDYANWFDEK